MRVLRPCLRCERENPDEAESCSACGAPLEVRASAADRRPVRAAGLSSGLRRLLLGVLAIAALLAVGWYLSREADAGPDAQAASWRRPETVAAWASERLERRRVPPERALALVEMRTSRPRRLLLTAHAPELEIEALVRAAAEVLLAARDEGERLLIHAALLEHGPAHDRHRLLLPASAAARVLTDEAALALLVATAERGGLPALTGSATEAVVTTRESRAEPSDEGDEGPGEPLEGISPPESEVAELAEAADPEAGVHVGLYSGEPSPITPARDRSRTATPQSVAEPGTGTSAGANGSAARKPLPVSILKGAGKRLAHSYEAGQQQVVLQRIWLHPRGSRALILRSLSVKPHGSLNDVEGVDFLYLVHDRDGNGRRDAGDEQIGDVVAFVDDDAPTSFEELEFSFGADGELAKLLLVVDFMDMNEGGTIMLTVPSPDGVLIEEVSSGAFLRVDGLPLNGTMTTLNGDLEPDPFQEELDRLAAEED